MRSSAIIFYQNNRHFFLYGFIGISAVCVDYLMFLFFFNTLKISAVISTVLSVSVATLYSFLVNAHFNFRVKDRIFLRMISFVIVSAIGMSLSVVIIFLLHDILYWNGNIAKAVSLPPIVMMQYFLNRHISFKK